MEKLSRASRPLIDQLNPAASTYSPTLQGLQRRATLAKRQNERRLAREKDQKRLGEKRDKRTQWLQSNRFRIGLVKAERQARREDWDLGPLAPRREAGHNGRTYGTLDTILASGLDKKEQRDWGLREGDRVVVVRSSHRDLGRIGKILSISKEKQECTVERVNMSNMAVADWQLMQEADKTPFRPYNFPLPLSAVRLVAPLTHPETGAVSDMIVSKLHVIPKKFRDGIEIPTRRIIAGASPEIEIPFPPTDEFNHPEADCDTLRLEVEDRTWTPTLSVPPMPSSIIDELRNKYSSLRTRHDDAWVATRDSKTLAVVEKKERLERRMISPLQELEMQRKAEKLAQGEPQLSDEMLSRIGELMAKNLRLDQAAPPSPQGTASAAE